MMENDWQISRVMAVLEAGGMILRTLIVVSSDNGRQNLWMKRIE